MKIIEESREAIENNLRGSSIILWKTTSEGIVEYIKGQPNVIDVGVSEDGNNFTVSYTIKPPTVPESLDVTTITESSLTDYIEPCPKCGCEGDATLEFNVRKWHYFYMVECTCGHTGMETTEYDLGYYVTTNEELMIEAVNAWNENRYVWNKDPLTAEEQKAYHDKSMEDLRQIRYEMWKEKNHG